MTPTDSGNLYVYLPFYNKYHHGHIYVANEYPTSARTKSIVDRLSVKYLGLRF